MFNLRPFNRGVVGPMFGEPSPLPKVTRSMMLAALERHGWTVETMYDQHGPFLNIDPKEGGDLRLRCRVPVMHQDDHTRALNDVYEVYLKWCCQYKMMGSA